MEREEVNAMKLTKRLPKTPGYYWAQRTGMPAQRTGMPAEIVLVQAYGDSDQRRQILVAHDFDDPTSPTGVMLAESIGSKEYDAIYSELRSQGRISSSLSPLSPTEGLGGR